MQIVTLTFFFFFLVIFLVSIPLKNYPKLYTWFLLLVNILFYSTWSINLAMFLLLETMIVYFLMKFGNNSSSKKKSPMVKIIILVSFFWIFFKYANFFVLPLQELFITIGLPVDISLIKIVAPLGISFFSFRLISSSISVIKGEILMPTFSEFASYISFFPQIASGPIMTLDEFIKDLYKKDKSYSTSQVAISISLGLFKKYILSSYLYDFIKDPFIYPSSYASIDLLLAAIAYSAYIYVDFSGYTDIANGISRLLGFRIIENFNIPYISKSVADFWRRWHITLGRWLKYHIYIPLGGSRKGLPRKYINLMIVMLFSGIWHGTGTNYIVWGGLHGIGIIIGDFVGKIANKISKFFPPVIVKLISPFISISTWGITLSFIILARIIFRSPDLETSYVYFQNLLKDNGREVIMLSAWREQVYILISYLLAMTETPLRKYLYKIFDILPIVFLILFVAIIIGITVILSPSSMPPFLYYKF